MKKLLESLEECGMNEMPPMSSPMDQGSPVSMNVSLNASGKDHVADLIDMMKNAGLGDAKPMSQDMMPMRMDMERLRNVVDGPDMEADEAYADVADEDLEEYENEPDYEYSDHEKMTHDLSGGINREKKAYAAAQRGDNAMAVEAIKAQLMAALAEKQKGNDKDGDGDEDFADVQIARMVASGMDKEKAIAKVKNKDYNK